MYFYRLNDESRDNILYILECGCYIVEGFNIEIVCIKLCYWFKYIFFYFVNIKCLYNDLFNFSYIGGIYIMLLFFIGKCLFLCWKWFGSFFLLISCVFYFK